MKKIVGSFILTVALMATFNSAQAQIAINNLGQVYSENFDSLGTNNVNWTNETTIAGWSFVSSTNGGDAGPVTVLFTNSGENTVTIGYNLGSSQAADRTLGALSGQFIIIAPTNEFYYGAHFINNSIDTITNVNVSYVGEQWRNSDVNAQALNFFQRVGGTNFLGDPNNIGWTAVPSLDFLSLQNTGANLPLDGNNPANRTNLVSDINVTIAPGQEFWIRWSDTDFGGVPSPDQTLGIDDVSLTFTGIAFDTNSPISPSNNVLSTSLELKKPKASKKLVFSGANGFKVKGFLRSTNTLTKASFAAFGGSGTNAPTNLTFTDFGKFQILSKGKLFKKKGVSVVIQTKGKAKAGIGIAAASSPVTLVIKVDGTQGTNGAASAFFTNVFSNVKVK